MIVFMLQHKQPSPHCVQLMTSCVIRVATGIVSIRAECVMAGMTAGLEKMKTVVKVEVTEVM